MLHSAIKLHLQRTLNEPASSFFYPDSNRIDNDAAVAAAGTLTTAAVLQSQTHKQQQESSAATVLQQQRTQHVQVQQIRVAAQQQQQHQQEQQQQTFQTQQAAMALLNGSANASSNNAVIATVTPNGINNTVVVKPSSHGRSTPINSINGDSGTNPTPGKLFFGGLSWQTPPDKLKEYFNMFGTVTDLVIMKDPITLPSRCFGCVTFEEPSTVDKVLEVPIHTLDSNKIGPKHATPQDHTGQVNKTKKIFIDDVWEDTSAEEVKAYFGPFGAVEETVMSNMEYKKAQPKDSVTLASKSFPSTKCKCHYCS